MKKIAALTLSLFLTYGTAFADTPKDTPKDADAQPAKPATPAKPKAATKTDKTDAAIAAEIEELRQTLQSQQEQLSLLKEELAKRDRQIDEARDAAAAANSRAAEATTKATEAVNTTAAVKSTADTLNTKVADLSASNEALKTTVATTAAAQADSAKNSEDGPASISYKGVKITPGGFIAAETVFRNRATSDDINTQFTGIPYPSLAMGKVPENVFSARQTRLSALVETNIASAKVTGYVETDFLGAAVTSNNRQSNSYVLRMRQLWARAAWDNGFAVTGGQMWSLVTESKKGAENRLEALPMMIDPQYIVGWAWQRAYGLRVTKTFDDKLTVAAAIEGPQTTIGGRGFGTNFFVDAPGQNAGLNNGFDATGYTINKSPDFLVKAALDPGWGHYEVVGILSPFRDRIYPCGALPQVVANLPADCNGSFTSVAGAYNASATGGGVGATARLPLVAKKVDLALHFQGGDGIGRYSSAQLSDVTARPNGTLAPIRDAAYLAQLEFHPSPKFDIYAYYGGEYAARTAYTYPNPATTGLGNPVPVGYGSPLFNNSGCATETISTNDLTPGAGGTCNGDVHNVIEGTLGFWHNMYQGSKGRLRWGMQYSYVTKIGWSADDFNITTGVAGVSVRPKAVDNMVFTSFRYYLP
jgi:hypothetical protein